MTNPMRVALEDARKAIASLHSWALGFRDVGVRPYKDELLAMIDTALASPEGRGEQAWAEPCFTWAGPRGDAPCNTCGHERLQHSQAIEPYADAPGKEHPDVARFRIICAQCALGVPFDPDNPHVHVVHRGEIQHSAFCAQPAGEETK